jgi:hypothetical protein
MGFGTKERYGRFTTRTPQVRCGSIASFRAESHLDCFTPDVPGCNWLVWIVPTAAMFLG